MNNQSQGSAIMNQMVGSYSFSSVMRSRSFLAVLRAGGLKVGAEVFALITGVLLARSLGASQYGIYSYLMAVVAVLVVPAHLGYPHYLIRQVGLHARNSAWAAMKDVVQRAFFVVLVMSLMTGVIAPFLLFVFENKIAVSAGYSLHIVIALIPLLSLGAIRSAVLRGLGHVALGHVPDELVRPIAFLLFLLGLLFLGELTSAELVFSAQLVATATAFFVGGAFLFAKVPDNFQKAEARSTPGTWFSEVFPFLVLAVAQVLVPNTGILVLGSLGVPSDVGVFRVISYAAVVIAFGRVAIEAALAPRIVSLHQNGDIRGLIKLVRLASIGAFLVAAPLSLTYWFLGEQILEVLFGAEFGRGNRALVVLSIGYLFHAFFGLTSQLLLMTGHAWRACVSIVIGVLVNIGASVLLVPHYGVMGAAVSVVMALVIWNGLSFHFVVNQLKASRRRSSC